jgi:hypothetical protein
MLIVDSQIHIWQNGLPPNPYHRQITSYSHDDALHEMDEAGVEAALIHPPAPRWDAHANELAMEASVNIPVALQSSGISLSIGRRVVPWWIAGSSGPACSAYASFPAAPSAYLAYGWHNRLAVACSRACWLACRASGSPLPARRRPYRRTASAIATPRRSHGAAGRNEGRRSIWKPAGTPDASQIFQRRRQSFRSAKLFQRALSLPQYPHILEADL